MEGMERKLIQGGREVGGVLPPSLLFPLQKFAVDFVPNSTRLSLL